MTVVEYKEKSESESHWTQMGFPPGGWTELKRIADYWGVSIRAVNVDTGLVEQEYHPYTGA